MHFSTAAVLTRIFSMIHSYSGIGILAKRLKIIALDFRVPDPISLLILYLAIFLS